MQPDHRGQSALDRKTLAKIHIAVKELCLDDDEYRGILERVCGVRSSRDLRPEQLMDLQRAFRRLGWQGYLLRRDEVPPLKYEELGDRGRNRPTPSQLRKLDALFNTTPGYGTIDARAAFRAFLRKRFGVEDARFLDAKQFEAALKAVREIRKRAGVRENG
jgi:hypothetical protein